MADSKISALPSATTPLAGTEVLPIVQSGATKKATIENVLTSAQPSGTANGVVYLNGSKVATSGSGLVFDGTNLGVSTTPSERLHINDGNIRVDTGDIKINNSGGRLTYSNGDNTSAYFLELANGNNDLRVNDRTTVGEVTFTIRSGGNIEVNKGNLVIGTSGKGIDFSASSHAAGMTSELLADYEEGTWTPNQGGGLVVVGAFSSSGTYTKVGRQVTVSGVVTGATSINTSGSGIVCTNLPFAIATSVPVGVMTNTATNNSNVYGNPTTSTMYSSTATGVSGSLYFTLTYITS